MGKDEKMLVTAEEMLAQDFCPEKEKVPISHSVLTEKVPILHVVLMEKVPTPCIYKLKLLLLR